MYVAHPQQGHTMREVELLLNGKSVGKKQNKTKDPKVRNQIRWNGIAYEPGVLEAVAYNNNKVVARPRIETTGEAVRLSADADNTQWRADGEDLQHVRVVALDKKGRRVQTTDENVTFSISGDARIVGVVNGDINSDEMMVGNQRRLYNGSCTVILRAGRTPGKVTLTATSPSLKMVTVKLETR